MTPDFFNNIGGTLIANAYPVQAGFKRSGTSQEAAASVNAPTLRDKVLAVLRHGNYTADEVAEILEEPILSCRPRLSELLALGKIAETSQRRRNASGKFASVWRVKEA